MTTPRRVARLCTGDIIPLLGVGTEKLAAERTSYVVREALRIGYTHVDTAWDSFNAKQVGDGLKFAFQKLGVQRKDVWVTGKLWNTRHDPSDVLPACQRTLKDLELEYIDLYLIHYPIAWAKPSSSPEGALKSSIGGFQSVNIPLIDTWKAMEDLVRRKLVRTIGVSNCTLRHLDSIIPHASIPLAVNQVEIHPYLCQSDLLQQCKERGVHVTAYSPMGSLPYIEYNPVAAAVNDPIDEPVVREIAKIHSATPAQVLLAWNMSRGCSTLVKSSNSTHLLENFQSVKLQLTEGELSAIEGLNRNLRFHDPGKLWGPQFSIFDDKSREDSRQVSGEREPRLRTPSEPGLIVPSDAAHPVMDFRASKTFSLKNGGRLPALGFNTAHLQRERAKDIVKQAIRAGFRHVLVGSGYENEHEVGEGICEALKEEGLRREDVFVSGKLWNTQHRKEHVRPACESLLKELGLEYLDLYMIAFPIAWKNTGKNVCDVPKDASGKVKLDFVPLAETWSAMEELVDAGLVKSIGLANFSSQLISDLLSYCRIKPVVNEVEMHPELQQSDMLRFGAAFGVHIIGCFPFGSPVHTAHGASTSPDEPLADHMLNCDTISNIAKRHSLSPIQALVAWNMKRGSSVVVHPTDLCRMPDDVKAANVCLDDSEVSEIKKMDGERRFCDPYSWWGIEIFGL